MVQSMRSRHHRGWLRGVAPFWLGSWLFAACVSEDTKEATLSPRAETRASDAGLQPGNGADPESEFGGSVEGRVVDSDGVPIAALAITLCRVECLVTDTNTQGVFRFEGVRPAALVLENLLHPGEDQTAGARRYTRFFDIIELAQDETLVITKPYTIREVPALAGPLNGLQELTPAEGLFVKFDADTVGGSFLEAESDGTYFGAIELAASDWPSSGLGQWRILRAWSFAVWDLHADDAFAVEASVEQLPADQEVAFLVADYTYGFLNGEFFEEPAVLSADGRALTTPSEGGIDRATLWLAVTK